MSSITPEQCEDLGGSESADTSSGVSSLGSGGSGGAAVELLAINETTTTTTCYKELNKEQEREEEGDGGSSLESSDSQMIPTVSCSVNSINSTTDRPGLVHSSEEGGCLTRM